MMAESRDSCCRAVTASILDVFVETLRLEHPDGTIPMDAIERAAARLAAKGSPLSRWYSLAQTRCSASRRDRLEDRRQNKILRVLLTPVDPVIGRGEFDRQHLHHLSAWLHGTVGAGVLSEANDRIARVATALDAMVGTVDYRRLSMEPQVREAIADLLPVVEPGLHHLLRAPPSSPHDRHDTNVVPHLADLMFAFWQTTLSGDPEAVGILESQHVL